MSSKTRNQLHPNRKTDRTLNGRSIPYRMIFKQGKSTFVFAENLSYMQIKLLEHRIQEFLHNCGSKLEGNFLKPIK